MADIEVVGTTMTFDSVVFGKTVEVHVVFGMTLKEGIAI
jgi:hypothetical protein